MRLASFFFISMKTLVTLVSLLSFYSALAHFTSSKKPLCHDDERSALLQFKESLINKNNDNISHFYLYDPCRSKSASWKANIDCCLWDGVKCNEKMVMSLSLTSPIAASTAISTLVVAFFQLLHLKWLNLAYNNFNGSKIPFAIVNLLELSYLNLSGSFFTGQIPLDILNLPNLVSLDLSRNSYFEFFRLELRQLSLENLRENSSNLKKIDRSDGTTASSTSRYLVNLSNSFTFLSLCDSHYQGKNLSSTDSTRKLIHLDLSSNELFNKKSTFAENLTYLEKSKISSNGSSVECFEERGLQILPEEVTRFWSKWQIRIEILLSLFLQLILTVFGSRRKCIPSFWIKIVVGTAYITANWIPTYALGVLLSRQGAPANYDCSTPNINFATIWASFFLWHLGGSDSITAYSLEDNDLWIRDFIASLFQVVGTVFLFLNSWSNDVLSIISIPLLIIGTIKAGERTFVLWSSSTKGFKYSLLTNPDPSPELVKIMEMDIAKEIERDSIHQMIKAHFLFKRFANLFAGLILGYREEIVSYNILHQTSANDAFSLVAIELGLMFDILYTKVTTIYSLLGILFRCACFVILVSLLCVFSILVNKHEYQRAEISITYILIVGTIVVEVYSFTLSLFSDWAKLCLLKLKEIQSPRAFKAPICLVLTNQKRWSESIGQFNLISICLKDISATCIGVKKFFRVDNLTRKDVDVELRKLIHEQLLLKINNSQKDLFEYDVSRRNIWAYRGENVLVNRYEIRDFNWCTVEVDFDHSFLLWHIATDICYYDDLQRLEDVSNLHPNSKLSKYLSDYMLYLLLFCPSMMPKGLGESRYKATYAEAKEFFVSKLNEMLIDSQIKACRSLLESNNDQTLVENRVGSHPSTLFYGCKIARVLQAVENEGGWSNERKWGMISEFWVEILAYAAIECEWREHGQQLKAGGELLTHVCLLMAHLGFSKQYSSYGRNI